MNVEVCGTQHPRGDRLTARMRAHKSWRPLLLTVGVLVALGSAACSSETNATRAMPDVVGEPLDVALRELESAGLEDQVDVVGGGVFGVVDESNWQVCSQSPAAGLPVAATPQLTVERSCVVDQAAASVETATPSVASVPATPAPQPVLPAPSAPTPAEVMSVGSSPELAAVLAEGDYCSDAIQSFALTYEGRVLEFAGHIGALSNHAGYETRYDILLVVGDFGGSSVTGPAFQFRDVGIADLNLVGPNIPDSIGVGVNLQVTATVDEYEPASCLFLLDPVATAVR